MPRQIEIKPNVLQILPDFNVLGVCPDYDEDCDSVEDHAACLMYNNHHEFLPCPYLD